MLANKQRYIDTIAAAVAFLQGKERILSLIASVTKITFPKATAGAKTRRSLEWAFGTSGITG